VRWLPCETLCGRPRSELADCQSRLLPWCRVTYVGLHLNPSFTIQLMYGKLSKSLNNGVLSVPQMASSSFRALIWTSGNLVTARIKVRSILAVAVCVRTIAVIASCTR
jgi:hypothetical protein